MKHRWLLVTSLLLIASAFHGPVHGEDASPALKGTLTSWPQLFGSLGIRFDSERPFDGRPLSHLATGRGIENGPPDQADLLDLKGLGILSDWHPFRNSFRLSLGMYLDQSAAVRLDGEERWPNFDIDKKPISLDTDVETIPYVGFGWRRSAGDGLDVNLDIGAFLHDEPGLGGASCPGLNPPRQGCESASANASGELSGSFQEFEWYPVLSLGIEYRF